MSIYLAICIAILTGFAPPVIGQKSSTIVSEPANPIITKPIAKAPEPIQPTHLEPAQAVAPIAPAPTPAPAPKPAVTAPTQAAGSIEQVIIAAANKYGVDPQYLLRIARCESGYRTNAYNASGATGLFQFMPATWASFSAKAGYGGASIYDGTAQANVAAWAFANGLASHWECK